jgi:hypothetical protein
MTNLLILIRNIVLATILAWLGIEFAPDSADKDEKPAGGNAIVSLLG